MSTYIEVARHALKLIFRRNRPLPSSKNPRFQNEARCTTFLVKMSFICMRMKNDFHIKGRAPTLVLKQRPGGTRKWPIGRDLSLQLVIVRVEGFFFQVKRQWVLDLLYYYSPLFSGKKTCATHGHISGISYMATVIRSTKELTMWVKPQKWWIRHKLALVTD